MIGNLIVRFKKGEDPDVYEGEFLIGLDSEANLDEYINNCIEDLVAEVSGEGLDNNEEVSNLEYYFEESSDEEDEDNLNYDWR